MDAITWADIAIWGGTLAACLFILFDAASQGRIDANERNEE